MTKESGGRKRGEPRVQCEDNVYGGCRHGVQLSPMSAAIEGSIASALGDLGMVDDLQRLPKLMRDRNNIERSIALVTSHPRLTGHIGEYIAARDFDIEIVESGSIKG